MLAYRFIAAFLVLVLIQDETDAALLTKIKKFSCFGGSTNGDDDTCEDVPLTIRESSSAFKDINTYLMQSVLSDDFEANIEQATQLLNKEVHFKKKSSSNRKSLAGKPGSNSNVEVLIKSLILLVDLDKVNQPGQCTLKVTQILLDNDKSANHAIERKLLSGDGSKSRASEEAQVNLVRIDELVFEAARRRAQFCYPTYEDRWFKLRKSLRIDRRYLRSYFDMILERKLRLETGDIMKEGVRSLELLFETSLLELVEYVRRKDKLGGILSSVDFERTLEFLQQTHKIRGTGSSGKEDNNDRKLQHMNLLEEANTKTDKWLALFAIHLIKPCERMATLLGSVYESMEFDEQLVDYINLPDVSDESGLRFSVEFYEDLIYYKMCGKLIDEKRTFYSLLSGFEQSGKLDEPIKD